MLAENKDEMREKILEAALKRFMHYGASKTTMNEIADDLRCSKASLYYYFSDKKALHNAVLMKIGEAFFQELESEADRTDISAEQIFFNMIQSKIQFIERFSRLELFKVLNDKTPEIQEIINSVQSREYAMHIKIVKRGVTTGEFDVTNPEEIGMLYQDAMEGLRFAGMSCMPEVVVDLDKEGFEKIVAQQKLLTEIFVRGIKKQ
ncbi:TetR/AcrR family transcriptional regulator [Chitinophaga rhizophila]|uniref:TetR/AcrR family transcriptional regulator n=1 Tax=Chitinophaga rhizophila TaxID=2866212 RepID=A0ABS7GHM0_9BACT|nr:TetR/AcrR family transcriptional regulator [Chitinophaga rhizophila]MBW8685963.1 TetR/AcrR family transcriptional regulator [Chitinophaga rhizophila]